LEDDPQLEDIEEKLSVLERERSSSKRQQKGAEKLVKGDLKNSLKIVLFSEIYFQRLMQSSKAARSELKKTKRILTP